MIKRNIPITSSTAAETEYKRWLLKADRGVIWDAGVIEGLKEMEDDQEKIEEAFYQNLTFGTGGLRGTMGAGTNRMNVHTVAKASQGLADYILSMEGGKDRAHSRGSSQPMEWETCPSVAVSYDSRTNSRLFAHTACRVFAANGIKAYMFSEIMPTPCLSFAVRKLHCDFGVMVTASHNPKEDNGYKVYGRDGCQITPQEAGSIYKEIEKLDIFDDIKAVDFQDGMDSGGIEYISQDMYTAFIQAVKAQSVLGNAKAKKEIPIVYSPLNGTGLKPVMQVLTESGFTNVKVVRNCP